MSADFFKKSLSLKTLFRNIGFKSNKQGFYSPLLMKKQSSKNKLVINEEFIFDQDKH